MGRTLLFIFGVALLLWSAWDNYKNPPEPEPFTWTGLVVKVLFILFFNLLFTALLELLGGW